jgi:hypothetical protein
MRWRGKRLGTIFRIGGFRLGRIVISICSRLGGTDMRIFRGFFTIILKYPELQKIKWKGLKEFKNQLYPEE